jgi:hypothetical protein
MANPQFSFAQWATFTLYKKEHGAKLSGLCALRGLQFDGGQRYLGSAISTAPQLYVQRAGPGITLGKTP